MFQDLKMSPLGPATLTALAWDSPPSPVIKYLLTYHQLTASSPSQVIPALGFSSLLRPQPIQFSLLSLEQAAVGAC